MQQHGLLNSDNDPKALTLQARLIKDRAKRALDTVTRERLFEESADLYTKAAALNHATYPLINAASLLLFAGKRSQSEQLARQVLDLIEGNAEEGETSYWREATRAEALLLLNQEHEARVSLATAIATQPQAWEDHAATIMQFCLILAAQGKDGEWLNCYRPPVSIHFSGITGLSPGRDAVSEAIEQFIAQAKPGFAYGALAAGADLLFAQAFIEYRNLQCPTAELHVILPFPVDQFRKISVQTFGDHWLPMFDYVIDQAASVTALGRDDPPLDLAIEFADRVAMGHAVRNAQILASQTLGVTVAAPGKALRPQLTSWQAAGRPLRVIESPNELSPTNHSAAQTGNRRLKSLIWAIQADWSGITSQPEEDWRTQSDARGRWLVCDNLIEACQLAVELARTSEAARVSILQAILDPLQPALTLLDRAAALAEASSSALVATDECTAMWLILASWFGAIEEFGELHTAWGREAVWSVS